MPRIDMSKVKTTDDVAQILTQSKPQKIYMSPKEAYTQRKQGQIWLQDGKQWTIKNGLRITTNLINNKNQTYNS